MVRCVDIVNTLSQFRRFVGVGVAGLLVLLGVTYTLTEFAHVWYFWAFFVGTLCGWTCIFLLNSLFTFSGHKKEKYATKYVLFLGMYALAFAINASIVYSLTSWVGVHYLLSIIIATAITTVVTFSISKKFIFTYGD